MDKIRNKYVEKNTNTPDNIREMVKEVYQVDVQAIKNLGELSKKILDANGVLELPYNVKITGNLETTGSTRTSSMDLGPDNCRWRFMGRNTGQAHEIGGLQIVRIKSDGSTVWSSGMILKTNLETGAAETSRINGNVNVAGNVSASGNLVFGNELLGTGNKFRVAFDTDNCYIQTNKNNFQMTQTNGSRTRKPLYTSTINTSSVSAGNVSATNVSATNVSANNITKNGKEVIALADSIGLFDKHNWGIMYAGPNRTIRNNPDIKKTDEGWRNNYNNITMRGLSSFEDVSSTVSGNTRNVASFVVFKFVDEI